MSDDNSYTLRIHAFSDSFTGHTNAEFLVNGVSQGTYGANLTGVTINGIAGGVAEETQANNTRIAANPSAHSYQDITLNAAQYQSAFSSA